MNLRNCKTGQKYQHAVSRAVLHEELSDDLLKKPSSRFDYNFGSSAPTYRRLPELENKPDPEISADDPLHKARGSNLFNLGRRREGLA